MFEYTRVSHEYLAILRGRGWRIGALLWDEYQHSGWDFHDVIIHNEGEWKGWITGLK